MGPWQNQSYAYCHHCLVWRKQLFPLSVDLRDSGCWLLAQLFWINTIWQCLDLCCFAASLGKRNEKRIIKKSYQPNLACNSCSFLSSLGSFLESGDRASDRHLATRCRWTIHSQIFPPLDSFCLHLKIISSLWVLNRHQIPAKSSVTRPPPPPPP